MSQLLAPPRTLRKAPRFLVLVLVVIALLVYAGIDGSLDGSSDAVGPSAGPTPEPVGEAGSSDDGSAGDVAAPDPVEEPLDQDEDVAVAGEVLGSDDSLTDADAERVLVGFLSTADELFSTTPIDRDLLADVATGSALAELEATAAMYEVEELSQHGTVRVVSVAVGTPDGGVTPVEVCLDDRSVTLVRDGEPVLVPERDDATRHIYGLVHDGTRWVVATHTFPDDPSC